MFVLPHLMALVLRHGTGVASRRRASACGWRNKALVLAGQQHACLLQHNQHVNPGSSNNPVLLQAEAQCAWLDLEGLVDGVVTDDNDAFLFGGQHVYRNVYETEKLLLSKALRALLMGRQRCMLA